MDTYDPNQAPSPVDWLELDEQERMILVEDYHREAGIELPNEVVHAVVHTVVENQLAMGEPVGVRATLQRLLAEGVDRHGALHAIGSVLTEFMHDLATGEAEGEGINEKYTSSLERIDARDWVAS